MPYLEPDQVLREFSRYALSEVRPALKEDEQFMQGQVGSMASTLRFLADELEAFDEALVAQRATLEAALADARAVVDDTDAGAALADAHERVETADGDPREVERTLLAAADDALDALDDLPEETAREAREPLYEFLDERVEAQLGLLGRPDDG